MTPIELTKNGIYTASRKLRRKPQRLEIRRRQTLYRRLHAPWCGYCKRLEPILDEFAKEYDGKLYIYKVNVDNEEELEAAFKIRTIPTLLLCRMDGNKEMMLGTMGKPELRKVIEGIL